MSGSGGLTRRRFLELVGGGVVVCVTLGPEAVWPQGVRRYPEDLNAYLRIDADGHVTVFTGKIEMGQGVMTSQAQMVAEDLGVALDAITMVLGDTDRCPWDMGTFGSLTTRMFGPVLRAAAAEARAVLVGLAAARLGVPSERLVVRDGQVSVAGRPEQRVTYGELADGQRIARWVGPEAVLRAAGEMRVMGTSPRRFDGPEKVTGRAVYAADVRRPGMLHARLLRPPVHGAELRRVDTTAAAALPGVTVVADPDLVAVLHADPERAEEALRRVVADWSRPEPAFDTETVDRHLRAAAPPPEVSQQRGDLEAARASAENTFAATYRTGYVAHAPIEPHAALAELAGGRLTVWASTQTPFPLRDQLASELGLAADDVRVITPYVGGAFGGKNANGQALEAARLARRTGRPVQVAWTRQEELFYDTFDPAAVVDVTAGVDSEGRLALWDTQVWAAGDRGAELFYDAPHVRLRTCGTWRGAGAGMHPFAVGPWRAPGAGTNVFARESHVDTAAAALGVDPLAFRLRNLDGDPRMRRVLQTAAEAFGWRAGPAPSGRGQGIACGVDAGTYVALCAAVEVDRDSGEIAVRRVVCAQDMGVVVNPLGATQQAEGCVTQGLGYALSEELRFRGGEILDHGFGTYELPTFRRLPAIEVVLVADDALAPQGGGEPAIVPMGAVLANAVFDATGLRLRRLPMTPERVRAAFGSAPETKAAAPAG